MLRAAIRREVASIQPFDEQEDSHRVDALAWIDSGAPLFRTAKPATPPKHLLVSVFGRAAPSKRPTPGPIFGKITLQELFRAITVRILDKLAPTHMLKPFRDAL